MSLINDALKRATAEKAREPGATGGPVVPPLQPVESKPTSSKLPWAIFFLGFAALAVAAVLWIQKGGGERQQVAQNQTAPVAAEEQIAAPAAPPTPSPLQEVQKAAPVRASADNASPVQQPLAAKASPQSKASSEEAGASRVAPSDVQPEITPPTESEGPRLQAIYYRLRGPTVVINDKTLRIGDTVDGIKVVSIQRTSVEVVQDGKYRTLTLQD